MRLGLGAKFTLTVLAILAATMAANTLYFLSTSAARQEQHLVERGRALGRLIALVSPEAILGFDFLLLNDYTREVSTQPDIAYGLIVNAQGMPMSSYVNGADTGLQALAAARPAEMLKLLDEHDAAGNVIRLEFPITHNEQQLGRFVVGISRESLRSQFREQLLIQVLVFACIVLFLSAAIYGVFRFNVLYPIRNLIAASREVGRGQYPIVEVRSPDEIGMLAQAFNTMAEEVKHEQAKLHRQANFDPLTGLPNRMMAFDRINQEIKRARRSSHRFAVYFVDLDNFKGINDSFGHAAGDELLVSIGRRLQAALRDADTVARLGGDEFLVLVPDVSSQKLVEQIAERLLNAVSEPQELAGRKVVARCSIGIAVYPDNGDSVETLMVNADNAMYQAKATQHGTAIFFTEEMNLRLRDRMQMEQDLNEAVAKGQLSLHFQAIVDTHDQYHHGAEVLLRWHHPQRGLVGSAEFIPLAEESGQIVAIGDWVLEEACRRWSQWRADGLDPGVLAVNISRIQFRKRLSKRLGQLMTTYSIPSQALELEITESVLLDDHREVAEELSSLRALGVTISLDDFGTGYSSLSYLKRFRFDALKIDRSFVAGLPGNPDDASLVKAILAMARGLDLRVVAEGVETPEQLAFVAAHGCHYAQGYLFARPVPEETYRAYLQARDAGAPLQMSAAPS